MIMSRNYHYQSHRIDFGNVTALTTNYETIMDNNIYHHSKEKMFVAPSSWTMPKGSKLQVGLRYVGDGI